MFCFARPSLHWNNSAPFDIIIAMGNWSLTRNRYQEENIRTGWLLKPIQTDVNKHTKNKHKMSSSWLVLT